MLQGDFLGHAMRRGDFLVADAGYSYGGGQTVCIPSLSSFSCSLGFIQEPMSFARGRGLDQHWHRLFEDVSFIAFLRHITGKTFANSSTRTN